MKIVVMGSGGVGGFFGGLLAKAGNDVTFVARGDHLKAIRENGLQILHQSGKFRVNVPVTDKTEELGPTELVIFAVKTYDTQNALTALKPVVGPQTTILTLQNGVESYSILEDTFGKRKVLPGTAYIESRISSPGIVTQSGDVIRIILGEVTGKQSRRTTHIHEELLHASINAEISPNILKALWAKFLFISSLAGLTSACRTSIGELIKKDIGYRRILINAMNEVEQVGLAHGIEFDIDVVQQTMDYVDNAVADIKASMHIDLEKGRRLELETFNGAVVRLGEKVGVDTPVNQFLYMILKPHIGGKSK